MERGGCESHIVMILIGAGVNKHLSGVAIWIHRKVTIQKEWRDSFGLEIGWEDIGVKK